MEQRCGVSEIARLLSGRKRLLVLTGAGISTSCGIPDYRDEYGQWKRPPPVRYQDFVHSADVRRRYWARSLLGWPVMHSARPGQAHRALVRLEKCQRLHALITQNVDGLHELAGSKRVLALHGRLSRVRCLKCRRVTPRDRFQERLSSENPHFRGRIKKLAPDGDAEFHGRVIEFRVPACEFCGGILKPDVVFFGEGIPQARTRTALRLAERADSVLVIGTSLMVYSSFRLVRAATNRKVPIVAINLGVTRCDEWITAHLAASCEIAVPDLVSMLSAG